MLLLGERVFIIYYNCLLNNYKYAYLIFVTAYFKIVYLTTKNKLTVNF